MTGRRGWAIRVWATIAGVKRWIAALLCLLSLALPLQGLAAASADYAAAAMTGGHEAPSMAAPLVVDAPAAGEHPCHRAADDAADASAAPGGHAGCTLCAGCHGGNAAAARALLAASVLRGAEARPGWRSPKLSAVDPRGLERPPRTRLA
jgi:hypothetical protein